jgi:hypothetical protein
MMNGFKVLLAATVLVTAVVLLASTVSGQSGDVIVTGAKEVLTKSASRSVELEAATAGVGPRPVAEYADSGGLFTLLKAPDELLALASQTSPHVVFEYADANRYLSLDDIPQELRDLAALVAVRVRFQYADASQASTMSYPKALFNDTTAPIIADIRTAAAGVGAAKVVWKTNEFADSRVDFGTQPGVYTHSVADPLQYKAHGLLLTGLVQDTTYYFIITSTDRSGNSARSSEYSFKVSQALYLPMILNKR